MCSKYNCARRITVHVDVASVLGGIVTSFLTTHLGPVKSVCSLPSSLFLSPSPHCPPSPASLLCPSPPSWSEFVPWSPQVWAALPRVPCVSTGGSEELDPRPGRSWPERGRGGWLQGRRKMRREKRRGEEKERNGEGRRNKVRRKVGREKRGGEEKQTRRDGMIQVHRFQFLVVPLTSFFEAESLPVGGTRGGNLITCLQLLNLHMERQRQLLPCGEEMWYAPHQCDHGLVRQVYGQPSGLRRIKPSLGTDLPAGDGGENIWHTLHHKSKTQLTYRNLNYKKGGHHGQPFLNH